MLCSPVNPQSRLFHGLNFDLRQKEYSNPEQQSYISVDTSFLLVTRGKLLLKNPLRFSVKNPMKSNKIPISYIIFLYVCLSVHVFLGNG